VAALSLLLEVQELDLASDRLVAQRAGLPERTRLVACQEQARALDRTHEALGVQRKQLDRAEHGLGGEVAEVAAKAKEVEDTLYSGKIKAPKELEAVQEELRLFRQRQSELEEKELELLEQIELLESERSENRSLRAQTESQAAQLEAAIRKAEGEIDAELAKLAEARALKAPSVPATILSEYERIRPKERLLGRGAAPLLDGSCGGCHVELPILEYDRMKAQPEDALLRCVQCKRVLVR